MLPLNLIWTLLHRKNSLYLLYIYLMTHFLNLIFFQYLVTCLKLYAYMCIIFNTDHIIINTSLFKELILLRFSFFFQKDKIYDTSSNLKWISLFSVLTFKRFFSVALFKLYVNNTSSSVIFKIFEFSFNVVPTSGAIPIL